MQKRMGCKADVEVQYRSNLSVVRIWTKCPTQSARLFCAPLKSEFSEEVISFIVYQDKRREIFHTDLPDSLHAEFRELDALDALDVVLRKDCCRTAD